MEGPAFNKAMLIIAALTLVAGVLAALFGGLQWAEQSKWLPRWLRWALPLLSTWRTIRRHFNRPGAAWGYAVLILVSVGRLANVAVAKAALIAA